jgi:hypothetical protein
LGNRKGFAISADFMLAAMIFFAVLTYSVGTYYYYLGQYNAEEAQKNTEIDALAATDVLLRTQGVPEDWELTGNPASVGLAGRPNIINPEKLSALGAMDYNYSKEALGLGADYYLSVDALTGGKIMEKGALMGGDAIVARRLAIYNETYVRVTLYVYG